MPATNNAESTQQTLPLASVHSTALFGSGDKVSVWRWDKTERPCNRMGDPATVLKVEQVRNCQSGYMVTVRGASGMVRTLDTGWLAEWKPNVKLCDGGAKTP